MSRTGGEPAEEASRRERADSDSRRAAGAEPVRYLRYDLATAITLRDRLIVARSGRDPLELADIAGAAASRLWSALARPSSLDELCSETGLGASQVGTVVESLVEAGLVMPRDAGAVARERWSSAPMERACERIVLGVCGCAQAAFTPHLVQRLLAGFTRELDVVLTETARRLVAERAISTLGARPWTDPWRQDPEVPVPHIALAEGVDMVLVLPASASALFRLAHSTCDDLLSLVVAATEAPVVVAPSMNPGMWKDPGVQRNAQLCRELGLMVVEPGATRTLSSGGEATPVGGAGLRPRQTGMAQLLLHLLKVGRAA